MRPRKGERRVILRDGGAPIEWIIGRNPCVMDRWGRRVPVRRTWSVRDLRPVFDRRGKAA